MRSLVLIATDHYVRNFVGAGAFERLDPKETFYVASRRGVAHAETRRRLEALPNYLGDVDDPRESAKASYWYLRMLLLAGLRRRSRTMGDKMRLLPRRTRLRFKLAALPGLRQLHHWSRMRRAGRNRELEALIERVKPDLVIAPTGGYDTLVWDGLRSTSELGIPSLLLVHNWDNLSSKGAFAVRPDYLGVWGEQSREHAERIHGFPRERVALLGAPSFESYFRHRAGSTEPPFPFRYVLFAGCYAPFDERGALVRLNQEIEEAGLDLKVVYRPHPHRRPRRRSDFVEEGELEHVTLDPQMRDIYLAAATAKRGAERAKPLFPALDYYPALFEHAEFVICPLSTMVVEAALFEKRVIVIAYDDGVHPNPPSTVVSYDHFEGIDRIDGFELCRREDQLAPLFSRLAREHHEPARPLREQVGWWLHQDERSYAERLTDLLATIAEREQIGARRDRARAPESPKSPEYAR